VDEREVLSMRLGSVVHLSIIAENRKEKFWRDLQSKWP
jgi:hypothetical protein